MKKSLVALAVLAASGASFAQSSVTVYGLADVWLGSADDGSNTTTLLGSGGVNTSRWGLKGSEDLGGGLKANFKLEQGFKLDTGAVGTSTGQGTGTQAFDRQSWVGLSGGFGEVQFGKVWSAYDDVSGASDAMFDAGGLAPIYDVFTSVNYIDRPINGFRYTTPEISGFTGALSYSLDEKVTGALSVTAVSLSYAAGPVAVQFGYQTEDKRGSNDNVEFTRLGGSYDFGAAVLKATYGNTSNIGNAAGFDADEYQIGVDVPVGSAIVVSASYAKSDDSFPGGIGESSRDGYGIGATYTLSKRTFLYGGYKSVTTSTAGVDTDTSLFAVGIQHRF